MVAQTGLPGEGGASLAPDPRGVWVNGAGDPRLALLDPSTLRPLVKANIPVGQDLPQIVSAPSGVWVVTDMDIRRLDPYTGAATTITPSPADASLPAQLSVDQTGTIWLASGTLEFFTPATGWRQIAGMSGVRAVAADNARIWVATGNALVSLRSGG